MQSPGHSQVAECELRQRDRDGTRWNGATTGHDRFSAVSTWRSSARADESCAGSFAASAGVELWAALKSLGRSGVRDLIERTCARAARFELLNDVVLNQVLVSFGDGKKAGSHSKGSGRCHLLVWRHGMAWPHRETHQPGVVGDDRIGHRPGCGCGDSNCA
jgi:hypothetical protein